MWRGILEEYRAFMPVTEQTPIVTLFEGNTPLYPLPGISNKVGAKVWAKFDGLNPTGSFKDRGMTMAITKAKEEGAEVVICASTGNTSASAAAYAVRAGMRAVVVIPHGKIALGKLAQAVMYGAQLIQIDGNFDQALAMVRELSDSHPITLVNSVNPYRIEGQKTAAFEICDALGEAPDYLAIPVGNAGNITAYWKGFKEYLENRRSSKLPKMIGFEAEGSAAIVKGSPIENPSTFATAIRIGNPASWTFAVDAARESNGNIDFVTDDQIAEAYRLVAMEGIFCEPASAASIAGILKRAEKNPFKEDENIVVVLTGNGLKDPDSALSRGPHFEPTVVRAALADVAQAIFR